MSEPAWVDADVIFAIHEAQLAEHGGASGLRDQSLLEAALARPKYIYAYRDDATLNRLAAAYVIGLAKNHAFVDGNKRVAWVVGALFLLRNGVSPRADPAVVVKMMLAVASGDVTEEAFAAWLDIGHPEGSQRLHQIS